MSTTIPKETLPTAPGVANRRPGGRRLVLPAALIALICTSAGRFDATAREATNALDSPPPADAALTTARLFELGSGASWNSNLFQAHFDADGFFTRALAHWIPIGELPADFRQCILECCQEELVKVWAASDSVRLVRTARQPDGLHCQYRLIQRSGQLAYSTLVFGMRDGRVGILDARDHATVPWLRYLAEASFLRALNDPDEGSKLPAPRGPAFTAKSSADFRQFFNLAFEEDGAGALALHTRLPPELQTNEFVRLTYAVCLDMAGRPEGERILDEINAAYPGNLFREIEALNSAYRAMDHYAFLSAATAIEAKNGPDAYLDVMRARLYRYHGVPVEAEAAALRAVASEPGLVDAHVLLVDLALKSGDYPKLAGRIVRQEQTLGVDLSRLAEQEEFADFARSKTGRDWLASHEKPPGSGGVSAAAVVRRHRLQGVFLSRDRPTALINGRTVEVGDLLPGGDRVFSIAAQSVTLTNRNGRTAVLELKK